MRQDINERKAPAEKVVSLFDIGRCGLFAGGFIGIC